ncbi:MAG: indole-3-glycerol-phosphate synthase TrpC, partial [Bacteroidales bacterium]|nr:indole-3-glycerol-phosphate synthase TrpC [Bacteroidales bacterium]
YQAHEAKAYGADIILLIASVLDKNSILEFTDVAQSLGLTVLLEVHTKEEIEKWNDRIKMIGVNNRNLNDFTVNIQKSLDLIGSLPEEALRISESGLQNPMDVKTLFDAGYQGFLMGERFMKETDPGAALKGFIKELNNG